MKTTIQKQCCRMRVKTSLEPSFYFAFFSFHFHGQRSQKNGIYWIHYDCSLLCSVHALFIFTGDQMTHENNNNKAALVQCWWYFGILNEIKENTRTRMICFRLDQNINTNLKIVQNQTPKCILWITGV